MLNSRTILIEEGSKTVDQLRKLTPKATGKTRREIRARVTKNGTEDYKLEIVVPGQFPFTTQFGRGKGKFPPLNLIEQWVRIKGLDVKPYVIAKTIAGKGTILYNKGGQGKKVDQVLDSMADRITKRLADLQVKRTLDTIDHGN